MKTYWLVTRQKSTNELPYIEQVFIRFGKSDDGWPTRDIVDAYGKFIRRVSYGEKFFDNKVDADKELLKILSVQFGVDNILSHYKLIKPTPTPTKDDQAI